MKARVRWMTAVYCLCAGMAGGLSADGGHADAASWFDETYRDFTEVRSNKWTTAAGVWRKDSANDRTAYSNAVDGACLNLDTRGGEIQLTPHAAYMRQSLVRLDARMTFTACRNGEEWALTNHSQHAAISMRVRGADESLVFIGWKSTRDGSVLKGRWIDLSSPDVTPEEDRFYDVTIEADYACVPRRVRYSVDGHVLADANGETWFSTRGHPMDPSVAASASGRHANKVGLRGRARVGEVKATHAGLRPERATVTIGALARPQAGDAVTFEVETNAASRITGGYTCQWYLADAAGMRGAAKDGATGTSYTLAAADAGHWVTVEVSDGSGYVGTGRFWFSDLPVVEMKVGAADGYVPSEDETAAEGVAYFRADEGDVFLPLEVAAGADLGPYREQYGILFTETRAVEWPTSRKETHEGVITIRGNAAYPDQVVNMPFTIHVRGNSTAGQDKKPYKIKLDRKTDLFGLGGGVKNKHWVLLANCFDESLMRNKLSYDLSGRLGARVWMKSEWVDVVMNGQYVGNYQLCQHVRVGEERIPVYEWDTGKVAEQTRAANAALTADDEEAIDTMLETNCLWMTSGEFSYAGVGYRLTTKKDKGGTADEDGRTFVYWKAWNGGDYKVGLVFEIDAKKVTGGSAPAPSHFIQKNTTSKGTLLLNVAMNTPEHAFTNPTVSNFVWETWWDLGQAWMSGTGCNAKGQHYSELADVDSMVVYWLAQYLPGNDDAAAFSRYSYLDADGRMVFGPAWDFDYGLGSLQIRTRSAAATNVDGRVTYAPISPEKFIPGNGTGNFMGHWTSDPYFSYLLRERYRAIRPYLADMVKDGGLIDRYKVKLAASARANDLRWNNRIGFFGDTNETGDADTLRAFLTRRFAWFDRQFATVGAAVTNVTKTVNASALRYTRTTSLAPSFPSARPNPVSAETDVADLQAVVTTAPLAGALAVPSGATALDVYVNGLSNQTVAVAAQSAEVAIPAAALVPAATNVLAFVARNADGTVVAQNLALVAVTLPERAMAADGGHDVPLAWLADAWRSIAAVDAKKAGAKPVIYADYLALATSSPLGKAVPLCVDYVAGTDPTDTNDFLSASIAVADGQVAVTWKPDREDLRATRVYTLVGAPALDGPWARTDAQNPVAGFHLTNRFFKVEVSLPRP